MIRLARSEAGVGDKFLPRSKKWKTKNSSGRSGVGPKAAHKGLQQFLANRSLEIMKQSVINELRPEDDLRLIGNASANSGGLEVESTNNRTTLRDRSCRSGNRATRRSGVQQEIDAWASLKKATSCCAMYSPTQPFRTIKNAKSGRIGYEHVFARPPPHSASAAKNQRIAQLKQVAERFEKCWINTTVWLPQM